MGLRLFIPSRNAARLLQIAPASSYIYTGHTRLLNRSSILKQGWRYSDPGLSAFETASNDTILPWHSGGPTWKPYFLAMYVNNILYEYPQDASRATHVVCELSNRTHEDYMDYMSFDWPYPMQPMFLLDTATQACFEETVELMANDCCKR
ncbi:hypothetical protein D915_007201 [Fasciola hepatica]|uniref:Uncharacterized protein n=1 Tax=Fasciola hepatica TaxID=6192 RepID=A0A4E0RYN6_FASHE|nr:hypothetical protein D915_007201 [Fasciola hepatica]